LLEKREEEMNAKKELNLSIDKVGKVA